MASWVSVNLSAIRTAFDSDADYRAINFSWSAAWAVLSGFSAKSGYEKVNECRDAKDMIEVRNR